MHPINPISPASAGASIQDVSRVLRCYSVKDQRRLSNLRPVSAQTKPQVEAQSGKPSVLGRYVRACDTLNFTGNGMQNQDSRGGTHSVFGDITMIGLASSGLTQSRRFPARAVKVICVSGQPATFSGRICNSNPSSE